MSRTSKPSRFATAWTCSTRRPDRSSFSIGQWRGDALWLYLDTTGQRSRVDKKLTLAQTSSGPQVWDWVGQSFLAGATLGWREFEGGYAYEAALPWASLNRQAGAAGGKLGLEAGMGFAGGFIDWTGTDPDTPSNLAPLTLVESVAEVPPAVARDPRADAVAIRVDVDGSPVATLSERVSPDRDYLWLDRIGEPLELTAGDHEIVLSFAGLDPAAESVVDGVWLVPRPLQRSWVLDDGSTVGLTFDPSSGRLEWSQ